MTESMPNALPQARKAGAPSPFGDGSKIIQPTNSRKSGPEFSGRPAPGPRRTQAAARRGIGVDGRSGSVSDIGILSDPMSLIVIALIFGSPGLLIGGISGALLVAASTHRRRAARGSRRICALAAGWMILKDVI